MVAVHFKSIIALCLISVSSPILAADAIVVDRPFVRVGDVLQVDLGTQQPNVPKAIEAMLTLPLINLDAGTQKTMSATEIEAMLVRRVPGLAGRLVNLNLEPKTFIFQPKELAKSEPCYYLSAPVDAGEPIARDQVSSADDCTELSETGLFYDPTISTYVATENLPAGFRLPIQSLSVLPFEPKGQNLTLTTKVGPVQVTRPVTLTEPLYTSGPTHVRTSDGAIVKAYFSVDQEVQP